LSFKERIMSNDLVADRFMRDVEVLLGGEFHPRTEDLTHNEQLDLDLAARLAAADFSGECRVRGSLRIRLLETSARRQSSRHQASRIFPARPRWVLAMAALLVLVVFLASPVGFSLAQDAVQIVGQWILGERTHLFSVQGDFQVNPGGEGQSVLSPAPESPGAVIEDNPIEEAGAGPAEFSSAGSEATFRVQQPSYLPPGYSFDSRSVRTPDQVELVYENRAEGRLLSILQSAVAEGKNGVEIFFTDDLPVQNVTVAGHEGMWFQGAEDSLLVWEADGVNFQLSGSLSLSQALALAESLQ
jgi:Domain of unknown function (DUF4367)